MASRLMCSFAPTIQTFSQIFVVGVCQETMFCWPQNIARWPWLSIPDTVVYLTRDKNRNIKFVFVSVCLLACIAWALTSKVTRKRERKQAHHFGRGSIVQCLQTVSRFKKRFLILCLYVSHASMSLSLYLSVSNLYWTLQLCLTYKTLLFNNFTFIFWFKWTL